MRPPQTVMSRKDGVPHTDRDMPGRMEFGGFAPRRLKVKDDRCGAPVGGLRNIDSRGTHDDPRCDDDVIRLEAVLPGAHDESVAVPLDSVDLDGRTHG